MLENAEDTKVISNEKRSPAVSDWSRWRIHYNYWNRHHNKTLITKSVDLGDRDNSVCINTVTNDIVLLSTFIVAYGYSVANFN